MLTASAWGYLLDFPHELTPTITKSSEQRSGSIGLRFLLGVEIRAGKSTVLYRKFTVAVQFSMVFLMRVMQEALHPMLIPVFLLRGGLLHPTFGAKKSRWLQKEPAALRISDNRIGH